MIIWRHGILKTERTPNPKFIIQVKTDNTGTSADDQIMLPIQGTDMVIDWGDGNVETATQANAPDATLEDGNNVVHTYDFAGTYNIKIGPQITRVHFNNGGDKDKLLDIKNWGDAVWSSIRQMFWGCSNVTLSARDVPVLTSVTDARGMFSGAQSFIGNESMKHWDVSNIIGQWSGFREMFNYSAFNVDISSWQLHPDLGHLYRIFRAAGLSTENYSRILIGWANQVYANGGPHDVDMREQVWQTYNNTAYGGTPFSNAVDARNFLTTAVGDGGAGWTITEDSEVT